MVTLNVNIQLRNLPKLKMLISTMHVLILLQVYFFGFLLLIDLRRNYLFAFIALEVMLLASSALLGAVTMAFMHFQANMLVVFLLATGGAESAVGLSLLIAVYKLKRLTSVSFLTELKQNLN
jgi:NADH:ubiquinone oxidoreductase subunit K